MADSPYPEKKSPLAHIKTILAVFGALTALSSLSKRLIEWKGFILDLITWYQKAIHPIFDFLLGWIGLPVWAYDYITVGLLIAASWIRMYGFIIEKALSSDFVKKIDLPDSYFRSRVFMGHGVSVFIIILWPIILVLNAYRALVGKEDESIYFFKMLGLILFLFAILLTINETLL